MKRILRIFAFSAIVAFVLGCVHNITEIVFSAQPQAGAEDTIVVKTQFRNGTGTNGYLVFAALFPTDMDMANNATVTMTTQNFQLHGFADVADLEFVPMEADATELKSNTPWKATLMTKYGSMGNYGDFEWVVWRSKDTYNLSESSDDSPANCTTADIKITFRNLANNVKFHFAAMYVTTAHGLEDDRFCPPVTKVYQSYGGATSEDYTVPKLVNVTPLKYTFEDIMGVDFQSSVEGMDTALKGETEVYMMGKVVLDDGTELVVNEAGAKNKMQVTGETSYLKYIYPRQFFNVPASNKIAKMYFWFQNADGSKVEDAGGVLYEKMETGTPLKK